MNDRILPKWLRSGVSDSIETISTLSKKIDGLYPETHTNQHTLVVPTFKRPTELRVLLTYLKHCKMSSRILVLDSSPDEIIKINKKAVLESGLLIEHLQFPVSISPYTKMHEGLKSVQTEFVSACADDDFVLIPGLRKSIEKLNSSPNASACHGSYFNFEEKANRFDIKTLEQSENRIFGDTALKRIYCLMESYEVLFYSVQRTVVAQECFASSEVFSTTLLKELHSGISQVIRGEVERIDLPYMARNTAPSHSYSGWHPHQVIADSPAILFNDYAKFKKIVLDDIQVVDKDEKPRPDILDMIFLMYLSQFTKPGMMRFIVTERFHQGRSVQATIERFWQSYVDNTIRIMHRRAPLFEANTSIFNPGVQTIGSEKHDFMHEVHYDHGSITLLFYDEFFFGFKDVKERIAAQYGGGGAERMIESKDAMWVDRLQTHHIMYSMAMYAICLADVHQQEKNRI